MPHGKHAPGVTPRTVAFPDELWERAQRYADAHEVSVSAVVRAALSDHLRRTGRRVNESAPAPSDRDEG